MHRDSEMKECPYFESDAPKMLDKLLEKGLTELPSHHVRLLSHERTYRLSSDFLHRLEDFQVTHVRLSGCPNSETSNSASTNTYVIKLFDLEVNYAGP